VEFKTMRVINEYSVFKTGYDKALRNYAKYDDISRKWVPNPTKAVMAIAKNDKQAMKQMMDADSVLPADQRIFPKIKQAYDNQVQFNSSMQAKIEAMKYLVRAKGWSVRSQQLV
jgi:hypothetical protein